MKSALALLLLVLTASQPARAGSLRSTVYAAVCACLVAGGCGPSEVAVDSKQVAASLKPHIDAKGSDVAENRLLVLRYFAASAGLVPPHLKVSEARTMPSEKFFRGVFFSEDKFGDDLITSTAFFNSLSSEEAAHFEIEVQSLGDFFMERFANATLKRVDVTYSWERISDTSGSLPAIQVVFNRGKGTSIRDATRAERLRVAKMDNASGLTGVETKGHPIKVIFLDIEDFGKDAKNWTKASSKWRKLLATAYPGEF